MLAKLLLYLKQRRLRIARERYAYWKARNEVAEAERNNWMEVCDYVPYDTRAELSRSASKMAVYEERVETFMRQ